MAVHLVDFYLTKNRYHFLRQWIIFFPISVLEILQLIPLLSVSISNVSINTGSSEGTVSKKKINIGEIAKFRGIDVLQMLLYFSFPSNQCLLVLILSRSWVISENIHFMQCLTDHDLKTVKVHWFILPLNSTIGILSRNEQKYNMG